MSLISFTFYATLTPIRVDPDFALAHFNLGDALQQKGEKAAALDEYRILKNLDRDSADKLFNLIYYPN